MTVLVTGASGLLGRAVAQELASRGHTVRTLQRRASGLAVAAAPDTAPDAAPITDVLGSITDPDAVARAFAPAPEADPRSTLGPGEPAPAEPAAPVAQVAPVDSVVHLAARVSLAGDPSEFRTVNVDGTRRLLDAAREAGASRFVFVSSPSVAHAGASLIGVGADPADPARARGDYARTKAQAELLALAADAPGFAVVVVRPHLVWGPGDTQLTERIVERSRAGRLPLLDQGRALIDTLYIDNAATGIAQAVERAAAPEVHGNAYVLTNGEPRPVAELLAGICTAAGVPAPTRSVPAGLARAAGSLIERAWRLRPGLDEPPMTRFLAEQLSTAHWFDQRRTRRDLEWTPEVGLDEGFERLARYYAGLA